MRINIEGQYLANINFRGVPNYTLNLIERLIELRNHQYSISFFDLNKERHNLERITEHLSSNAKSMLNIYECNDESYKTIMDNALIGFDETQFPKYNEYFGIEADIYHFPHSAILGMHMPENTIVTVNDIIPIIFKNRGYWSKDSETRFINSHNYLKRRKDIPIIAISQSTKRDLCEYLDIDAKRIHVVYDAYDEKMCFPDKNTTSCQKFGLNTPYIMYVGAIDPRKGIMDIVTAFGLICEKYKDLKLVLAGKVDAQFGNRLKEIQTLSYSNKIVFPGYISDIEKRHLLSAAEMFLFPSEYEGFGIPVLEAMACGCPTITTNVSSLPEVCGDAALYVDVNQPEQIAEKMQILLDSPSTRNEYIHKSLSRAKMFSWRNTAEQTEKIYELVKQERIL